MVILDCENYNSTITSICNIYDIDKNDVVNFLRSIDINSKNPDKPDQYIRNSFDKNFGQPIKKIDSVMWFHLTRTVENSDFSEGILPLDTSLEKIWEMLLPLVNTFEQRENLTELRVQGVPNKHFKLKVNESMHQGPYGLLILDVGFRSEEVGNHDYLGIPEIIEDICDGYHVKFNESIKEIIINKLKKCVVKFEANTETKETNHRFLTPALSYCWCIINEEELGLDESTCFDSEGKIIPKNQIIEIKFIS
jgi:hypothetical protein